MWTVLAIIGGALVYLHIGRWLAKKSVRTWRKSVSNGAAPTLLFPVSALRKVVGQDGETGLADDAAKDVDKHGSCRWYDVLMSLFWPIKAVFNLIVGIPTFMYLAAVDLPCAAAAAIRKRLDARSEPERPTLTDGGRTAKIDVAAEIWILMREGGIPEKLECDRSSLRRLEGTLGEHLRRVQEALIALDVDGELSTDPTEESFKQLEAKAREREAQEAAQQAAAAQEAWNKGGEYGH